MIANSWRKESFPELARYLEHGRSGEETGRVEWWERRNLAAETIPDAAEEMAREARLNDVVRKPVYHLEISFPPSEIVAPSTMIWVADSLVDRLALDQHQAVFVAHNDKPHEHIHGMVNLVHPWTHRAWDDHQDHMRIERALRELERELGLQETQGRLFQLTGQLAPSRARTLGAGEYRRADRTKSPSMVQQARDVVPDVLARVRSIPELTEQLAEYHLHWKRTRGGLVIGDGHAYASISRIADGASLSTLEARFAQRFAQFVSPAPGRQPDAALRGNPRQSSGPGGPASSGRDGAGSGGTTSRAASGDPSAHATRDEGGPAEGDTRIGNDRHFREPARDASAGEGDGDAAQLGGAGAHTRSSGNLQGVAPRRGAATDDQRAIAGSRTGISAPSSADGGGQSAVAAGPGADGSRDRPVDARGQRGVGPADYDARNPGVGRGNPDRQAGHRSGGSGQAVDGLVRSSGQAVEADVAHPAPEGAPSQRGSGGPLLHRDRGDADVGAARMDDVDGATRIPAHWAGGHDGIPEIGAERPGNDAPSQPLAGATFERLDHGSPEDAVNEGRVHHGRFEVEHLVGGRVGIRDGVARRSYLATNLADAEEDIRYLEECAARGDEEEIQAHLNYNAVTAERLFVALDDVRSAEGPAVPSQVTAFSALAAAWRDAVAADEVGAHAGDRRASAEVARRELIAARHELLLAEARVERAINVLYANPAEAATALAERLGAVGWERTIEEVRGNPAVIAAVGPLSRFGPASMARAAEQAVNELTAAVVIATARSEAVALCEDAVRACLPPEGASVVPSDRLLAALETQMVALAALESQRPQPDAVRALVAEVRAGLAQLRPDDRAAVIAAVPQASSLTPQMRTTGRDL